MSAGGSMRQERWQLPRARVSYPNGSCGMKLLPKFFQRPCSISGQGVSTVWGAERNGGDVAGKQQPWRQVLPGSSAWGMFCNERGPKTRVIAGGCATAARCRNSQSAAQGTGERPPQPPHAPMRVRLGQRRPSRHGRNPRQRRGTGGYGERGRKKPTGKGWFWDGGGRWT